jgi:hypothetical protein
MRTWRGTLIGALLIVPICFWNMYGWKWGQSNPATASLFFNVVALLFVVTLLNVALHRFIPRCALSHGEMIIVYVMLSIAAAICGLDLGQVFICIVTHPIWFQSNANRWAELFLDHVPRYLVVNDLTALKGYLQGGTNLYAWEVIQPWIRPLSVWGVFIFVLSFGMLCLNVLVRKEWSERARLSFPIIQLPLEMTRPDGRLFKNKLMWMGLGFAFFLNFNNGMNVLVPTWPSLGGVPFELLQFFPDRPWNAMGSTILQLFPFVVGIGFFIPLDLSFSCWFFYLFWKVERILSSAMGYYGVPRAPFLEEQAFGAYVAVCVFSLWVSRRHLKHVLACALRGAKGDDADEPMSYRAAFVGFIASWLFLSAFSIYAGMGWWVAIVFFVIYFAISTAIARMRAELGSPVHDLHFAGPHYTLTNTLGTTPFSRSDLTLMAFYHFFNRAYRGHEMPHQLEGMKLSQESHLPPRKLLCPILIAITFGTFVTFWSALHMSYHLGGHFYFGRETFNRLQTQINSPTTYNLSSLVAVAAGFVVTTFLGLMRFRYPWWMFHPAGYAVSNGWSMNQFWLSLFFAWMIKATLLKYAGIKSYRAAIPFFMGLILGDFLGGSMWTLYGIWLQRRVYNFLP